MTTSSSPLQFHLGVHKGTAIATCPQTGHAYAVPLRDVAARLRARGELPPLTQSDLQQLDTISGVWVGDDFVVGDDDVIEVAGKAKGKIKKAVKKTVKVAKKAVKSGLGKVMIATASAASGGAAGGALKALSAAKKLKKKAKKGDATAKKQTALGKKAGKAKLPKAKPAKPTQKKSHPLVKAKAKAQGKPSAKPKAKPKAPLKKLTAKLAKKNKVQQKGVHDVAVAEKTERQAQRGDPTAQAAVEAVEQIENAQEMPLEPASFEPQESDGGGWDEASDEEGFAEDPSMFDDGQGEVLDMSEAEDEADYSEEEAEYGEEEADEDEAEYGEEEADEEA